ncbi:MAG: 2-amino-4-hydroxy-6-hydroxymethyldihydropteridine diphosphokinase [Planctomycetota bacterium]
MKPAHVTLGLGANLGDREATLATALRWLGERDLLVVTAVSPIVESEAHSLRPSADSDAPAPSYLNQVAQGHTQLQPLPLLAALQKIEAECGRDREREGPWGARRLDIDILDFDSLQLSTPQLVLPHPRIAERTFVLMPWAALAPEQRVPGLDATIAELLAAPGRAGWVRWWQSEEEVSR